MNICFFQAKSKRRTIVMLALVVLVFSVCWLPLNLFNILSDFNVIKSSYKLFLIFHWFAMSSVCYNPFIYFWLNKQYRKAARTVIRNCFRLFLINRRSSNQSSESIQSIKSTQSLNRSKLCQKNSLTNCTQLNRLDGSITKGQLIQTQIDSDSGSNFNKLNETAI